MGWEISSNRGQTMKRAFFACILTSAALLAPGVAAADGPTALSCTFESGASWSFKDGKFSSVAPATLAFDLENIDLDGQRATLRASPTAEPGTVAIARAIGASHFLEVATEGFWYITTIYEKDAKAGVFPAVHSRHFGLEGQPVFSQYAGTCKEK